MEHSNIPSSETKSSLIDTSNSDISLNTSLGILQVDAQNDAKDNSKSHTEIGQFDDAQSADSGAPDLSMEGSTGDANDTAQDTKNGESVTAKKQSYVKYKGFR